MSANLKHVAARALSMLDLTSLNDDDDSDAVITLCRRGVTDHGQVAAVCVWPRFVALAKAQVGDANIKVAAVANFPAGDADVAVAVEETQNIIRAGGNEVDVVFPYRSLQSGDAAVGGQMVRACKQACGTGAQLKVIIESGELQDPDLIRLASRTALENGADFIKTSTGKVSVNATLDAATIMLTAIKEHGSGAFKAAGGIRDTATAGAYLAIAEEILGPDWATPQTFRFGASGVLTDLLNVLDGGAGASSVEGY